MREEDTEPGGVPGSRCWAGTALRVWACWGPQPALTRWVHRAVASPLCPNQPEVSVTWPHPAPPLGLMGLLVCTPWDPGLLLETDVVICGPPYLILGFLRTVVSGPPWPLNNGT